MESVALMLSVLAPGATPRLSRVLSIVRIVVRLSRDGRVVVVVVGHDPCGEDLLGLLVARIEVHVVLVIVLRRVVHQWGRVGIVQVQEAVILKGLERREYRKRDKKKVNKLNIDKDDGERFTGLQSCREDSGHGGLRGCPRMFWALFIQQKRQETTE